MPSFIKIVQAVKKLNSISRARLSFRRRPILCTTLYRNLMQASNFGGTFDQFFLWIFLWNFHRRCPSTSSIPWCKKSQKWPKTQIKARSCLNPSSFEKRAQNWLSFTLHAYQLETSDATLWCPWHRQTRLSLRNRWAWRHGNQPAQQCIVLMQSFHTGMRISLCITLQGLKPGLDTAASNRLAN